MEKDIHHTEHVENHTMETTEQLPTPQMKHNSRGIVLVPQPSDDPRDPLVGVAFSYPKCSTLTIATELANAQEVDYIDHHMSCGVVRLVIGSRQQLRVLLPGCHLP